MFLACISPTPLPYEHVKKGMNHRNYLEIDPKFAAELGIAHDTEVSQHTECTRPSRSVFFRKFGKMEIFGFEGGGKVNSVCSILCTLNTAPENFEF